MTRLLIDSALPAKLSQLTEPVELCDEFGHVVGQYIPASERTEVGPREPQVNEEELDRRSRSNEKAYSTAEVIAYLEKL